MRDTDKDWRLIAETEPYFGVIWHERFLSKNLTEVAIEDFFRSGEHNFQFVKNKLSSLFGLFSPQSGLDFGCGLGRFSIPMAKTCTKVVAVDIAPAMLAGARERASLVGQSNIEFVLEVPEGELFTWINSFIVFQHIPPETGMQLLRRLLRVLEPGGYVSIQMTFFREGAKLGEITRDAGLVTYSGKEVRIVEVATDEGEGLQGMRMYDYNANEVLAAFFNAKIHDISISRTDHGGHYGAWLFGQSAR